MDVAFLGTGSGYPTPCRGASAIALRYEGEVWLVDCGEGTQTQVMKLKTIRPGQISKIFITHLHGDHMFGLPGLLCTISMAFKPNDDANSDAILPEETSSIRKCVEIFGPIGLRRFLREALNLSRSVLSFKYVVHELVPNNVQYNDIKIGDPDWNSWSPEHTAKGSLHFCEEGYGRAIYYDHARKSWPLCSNKNLSAAAGQLKHRIPSFGFVFKESTKPGKLNCAKLIEFGVPKGPLFGRIKNGEVVTLEDGRCVDPSDFVGPVQLGKTVAILQDTCDSSHMREMCQNCTLLIHEATNENTMQKKCIANGHSTPAMAASFAHMVAAEKLILTHVSQRYKHHLTHEVSPDDQTTDILVNEAKLDFSGPIIAAYDGLVVNVNKGTF